MLLLANSGEMLMLITAEVVRTAVFACVKTGLVGVDASRCTAFTLTITTVDHGGLHDLLLDWLRLKLGMDLSEGC